MRSIFDKFIRNSGFFKTCLVLIFHLVMAITTKAQIHPLISGTITGQSPVVQGTTWTYTLNTGSATSWTCSCGTVQSYTTTTCTVYFNQTSCTSSTIAALSGGTTLASEVVTVTAAPALVPGSISNPTQTINYDSVPAQIDASASTGGSCSSYAYQWYSSPDNSDFTAISGATDQNYQPAALTATTYYKRQTVCFSAGYTSNTATVTVYAQLVSGTVSPSSQAVNYNATAGSLTTTAATGGNGSYSYQWYSSPDNSTWTAISGATSSSYSPGTLTATTYYHLVTASNGLQVTSAASTATVYPQMVSGAVSPSGQTINYNTAAGAIIASAATGGSGTYSYQWYSSPDSSTWTAISGASSLSYNPGTLTATTYYHLVSTSNGATVSSGISAVTVYPQLVSGTVSPSSQGINYNTLPGALTASAATGGNGTYSYQWYSSPDNSTWTAISGAISLSYSPGALMSTTYYHLVSTSNGAPVTSASSTVSVYPPLVSGTVSPSTQAISYNTTAGTVTATAPTGGSGTYSYQWYSSPDNSTWTSISGANSLSYSPGTLAATTHYHIVSTSNGVAATSLASTVTVYPQLVSGAVSPYAEAINYNSSTGLLTAAAATGGNGTYTYQWQDSSAVTGGAWVSLSGATSLTYTSNNLLATTCYHLLASSYGVTVLSNTATVTVYPALVMGTVSPSSQTINYDSAASLSSTAPSGGSGSYTYQWLDSSASTGGIWTPLSGSTGSSCTATALIVNTYFKLVTSSNGVNDTSGKVSVTVYPQLIGGTFSPASGDFGYNYAMSTTLTYPTGGNGSYTFQCYRSTDSVNWTSVALTLNTHTGKYIGASFGNLATKTYVRLTSSSNGANVTITYVYTIDPQLVAGVTSPTSQGVNFNTSASIGSTLPTGGSGTYTYQWSKGTLTGGTMRWNAITGDTSRSLSLPPFATAGTNYYQLTYYSNGIGVTSVTDTIVAYAQLFSGTVAPQTQTINYDSLSQVLTATASTGGSGGYTYQWYKSSDSITWSTVSGATSLTYTPGTAATAYYRMISTTSNGQSDTTATVSVLVYPQLVPGTISTTGASTVSYGTDPGSLTGTGATGGNGTYTYQWQSSADGTNWNAVTGATSLVFDPGSLYDTTYYKLNVTSNGVAVGTNVLAFLTTAGGNAPGIDTLAVGTATAIPMPGYGGITGDSLNYIRTRVISKPGIIDTVGADGLSSAYDVFQETQYFDGLGRPIQSVAKAANPSQMDLINATFYDAFGRISEQYLPYTDGQSTGTFRSDASVQQPAFYDNYFNHTEGYYYGQTTYESSPLNRVLKSAGPGNSWTGSNRASSIGYLTNTAADQVRIWNVTGGENDFPASNTTYFPGTLYVTQTTDENGHSTREYRDLDGRVVLKKVQEADAPSAAHDGWSCTYYVYDNLENLRCIIPPKAVASISGNGWALTGVQNLCFQYAYDFRNRMILKKAPDAAAQYFVYNDDNLSVLTQDGNLRAQNKWGVSKYDSLDRPIQSGIFSASTNYTLDQMQGNENGDQQYPETFTVDMKYFYDNYTQVSVPAFTNIDMGKLTSYPSAYPDTATQSAMTNGMATAVQVRILEAPTTTWLTTVNYYDEKGRSIQSIADNISGSKDTSTILYDFIGHVLSSYSRHNNAASMLKPHTTVLSAATLDHVGRVLDFTNQLDNNGVTRTIDTISYDPLGRLTTKTLGRNIESLNYSYNISGWLTGINKDYVRGSGTHYFGMELSYDYGFSAPQYNGNISGVKWRSIGNGTSRAYGLLYDNLNRLVSAPYKESADGTNYASNPKVDFSVPQISYDPNGNILTMNQNGLMVTSSGAIDRLSYAYTSSSNQVQSITDSAPADSSYYLGDFQDGNTTGNDYSYDQSGNLTIDRNKNIDSIRYNYLNLPEYIHIKSKGTINYVYDAGGVKYQKIVTDSTKGGRQDTTTYMGPFVYHNDTLQFISHSEGRVRYVNKRNQVSGTLFSGFVYDYFLSDHLGNTRMVLTEEQDTAIYAATMESLHASTEDTLFNNISTTQYPTPAGFEPSSGGDTSNHYVSRLNGGAGGNRVGPAIVLKVMAQDTVGATVFGWYQGSTQPPPAGETPLANDLLSTLTNDVVGQGGERLIAAASPVSVALVPALASFFSNDEAPNYNTAQPKAFLNWVLFDDQMSFVSGGVQQIPSVTGTMTKQTIPASIPVVAKNGYIYVYVSNESQQDVFFDNLNVQHRRGPITEEEHYYPFGLTMAGISDRALQFAKYNKYRFNGGNEQQSHEFSDGSGLELYDAGFRMYDAQIGRFHQIDALSDIAEGISPYSFGYNNPLLINDPMGLQADSVPNPNHIPYLPDIVITPPSKTDPSHQCVSCTGPTTSGGGGSGSGSAGSSSGAAGTTATGSAALVFTDEVGTIGLSEGAGTVAAGGELVVSTGGVALVAGGALWGIDALDKRFFPRPSSPLQLSPSTGGDALHTAPPIVSPLAIPMVGEGTADFNPYSHKVYELGGWDIGTMKWQTLKYGVASMAYDTYGGSGNRRPDSQLSGAEGDALRARYPHLLIRQITIGYFADKTSAHIFENNMVYKYREANNGFAPPEQGLPFGDFLR